MIDSELIETYKEYYFERLGIILENSESFKDELIAHQTVIKEIKIKYLGEK